MSDKAKLLIVDDDKWIRDILHDIFQGNHDVFVAANAIDGLTLKDEHGIRILLTDIQMSGMSGIELCARIRKNDSDSILYALTGNPDLFTATGWRQLGFDSCFAKPFEISEIKNAVERADQVLRQRDARPEKSTCKQEQGTIGD